MPNITWEDVILYQKPALRSIEQIKNLSQIILIISFYVAVSTWFPLQHVQHSYVFLQQTFKQYIDENNKIWRMMQLFLPVALMWVT